MLPLEVQSVDNNKLIIYPNPTNSLVYLSKSVEYKIYNTLGDAVLVGNDIIIDMSSLNNGLYFLESESVRKKIIKQ